MNDIQRCLIEAGIRAPSGDNCQPWKFRLTKENEIDIYISLESSESFFDTDLRATYLSIGAVIENIRIAAATNGYVIDINYSHNPPASDMLAARLKLTRQPASAQSDSLLSLYRAMIKRTVNRRPYLPFRLSKKVWEQLQCDIENNDVKLVCYDKGAKRRKLTQLIRLADIIRWTHPKIHSELFGVIRYNAVEAEKAKNGLEIDRLGIGPFSRQIMRFLSSWKRLSMLNSLGLAHLLAGQSAMLAMGSSGLVGVWINEDTPINWMRGGEVVERLWVRLQELKLSVQPLPIGLYLYRRHVLYGNSGFMDHHIALLERMNALISKLQPENQTTGIMLFRVGKAIAMDRTAIRRPVDDFII